MRMFGALLIAVLVNSHNLTAQPEQGLSGSWKLNPARSDIRNMPVPPDPFLKVEESAGALTVAASSQPGGQSSSTVRYPFDGRSVKRRIGDSTMNTATKWEGAALLVNTLVSGPQNYTVMERWKRSRDGNTLTIQRTIVNLGGETESVLVYESPSILTLGPARQPAGEAPLQAIVQPVIQPATQPAAPSAPSALKAPEPPTEYTVDAGTRVLLRLTNAVNTKHTAAGDRVYLETVVPVFVNGHLVIPRGSNVTGTITESQRAGRVKGKSGLNLRFESITLPNGVTRNFRSRASSVGTAGDLDHSEGKDPWRRKQGR